MNRQAAVIALSMLIKLSKEMDGMINLRQYDKIDNFNHQLSYVETLSKGLISYIGKGADDFLSVMCYE